jgi:G3E family GTPase
MDEYPYMETEVNRMTSAPIFSSNRARRTPVSIITGFLGSGKTTLLNRVLQAPDMNNVAVLINEFGEVSLDQYFIDRSGEDVITMPNGCLCCTAGEDLESAISTLYANMPLGSEGLRCVLIETSGLADPAPIAQLIINNPLMSRCLMLDSIVATADVLHIEQHLNRYPECLKQIAMADCLVITKTDLVDARTLAQVQERLSTINRLAPVFTASHGIVDVHQVFGLNLADDQAGATAVERAAERLSCEHVCDIGHDHSHDTPEEIAASHYHSNGISSFSIVDSRPLAWHDFDQWFRRVRIRQGDLLLRVKGIINIGDREPPVAIHAVHHVFHPPTRLGRWPSEDHSSKLVFVTRDLPAEVIRSDWEAFRAGKMH